MPAPEESYELDRDCPRCWHCDDMGDVHHGDGEWLGFCSCAAGDRLRAESEYRSWFPILPRGVPASPAMDPQRARELADPSHAAFEDAMRETWQMVDPFRPPNPGTYALGEHNGIAAALKTLRENYERHRRTRGVGAIPATGGGWEPDAWAAYIAGMLVSYLSSENAAREVDRREAAIAGIIRRRIHWLIPARGVGEAQPQQQEGSPK